MSAAFQQQAHQWQVKAISRLCKMSPCSPLLLVRPTGGGKSAVRNTYSIITCGVTLTITPLLSLSADQVKKLKKASQAHGHVVSFHLDEVKDMASARRLSEYIYRLPRDTNTSVLLFASPQALQLPHWQTMIKRIITQKTLKLVAVDEVHLYSYFGLTFRQEFLRLKDSLAKVAIFGETSSTSSVPLSANMKSSIKKRR